MKDSTTIIKDLLKGNYYINSEDIKNVINAISNEEDFNKYIDNISIGERKRKYQGSYDPNKKELSIQPIYINYTWAQTLRNYNSVNDNDKLAKYNNLFYLIIILHELEHVKQVKYSVENNDNRAINKLVNEGIELGRRSPDKLSVGEKILYNFTPFTVLTERDAEIKSIYNIVFNDEIAELLTKEEYYCLVCRLHKLLIRNYEMHGENVISPSKRYYQLRGKSKEYKDIEFEDDYDHLTKLSWGMPVDYRFIEYFTNEAKVKDVKRLIKK
ncbi:MAG TPA: hypothetical protein PLV83_00325 [Bacilli bacterium]|nr:hypothetical protein [Bacilli bacterium]